MKRSPLERKTPLRRGDKPLKRTSELKRTPLKQRGGGSGSGFTPASKEQRARVAERGYCIACGVEGSEYVAIDPAHLTARSKGGCSHELCVVGLCRSMDGGCHRAFDDGTLDLLRVIAGRWPAEREQVQHMLEHLHPVSVIEQLANARTQWSDSERREAA